MTKRITTVFWHLTLPRFVKPISKKIFAMSINSLLLQPNSHVWLSERYLLLSRPRTI